MPDTTTTNPPAAPYPGVSREQLQELADRAVARHLLARHVAAVIADEIDRQLGPEFRALTRHLATMPVEGAPSHARIAGRSERNPFRSAARKLFGF